MQTPRHFLQSELVNHAEGHEYPEEGPVDWTPGSRVILPITLLEGKSVEVPILLSEKLQKWNDEGRIEHVELNVRIAGLEADLNEICIQLNDHKLPDELLELEDLTFRYVNGQVVTPYGFVYKYGLSPDYYPVIGMNGTQILRKH